jgi:hypothetical protein
MNPRSFGLILYPNSGILAAYATKKNELESALGLFLFSWVSNHLQLHPGLLPPDNPLTNLLWFVSVAFPLKFIFTVELAVNAWEARLVGIGWS